MLSAGFRPIADIDWDSFTKAVDRINGLRSGAFITLEEARKRRNYDKFIEADIHIERPSPDREGHDCCECTEKY